MPTILIKSLSFVNSEKFEKMAFLTSDLRPRSKVMAPSESPYMISYISAIQMGSLTLVICDIFEKQIRSK